MRRPLGLLSAQPSKSKQVAGADAKCRVLPCWLHEHFPFSPSHLGLSKQLGVWCAEVPPEDLRLYAPSELSQLCVLAFEHSGNVLVSSHLTLLIAVPWKVCFSYVVLGWQSSPRRDTQEEVFRARCKAICCQGTAANPLQPTDMGVCHALRLAVWLWEVCSLWASLSWQVEYGFGLSGVWGSPYAGISSFFKLLKWRILPPSQLVAVIFGSRSTRKPTSHFLHFTSSLALYFRRLSTLVKMQRALLSFWIFLEDMVVWIK